MPAATAQHRANPPALRAVALLPARLASTRLPRKMLLAETGSPLFVHAAENAARCKDLGRVVVATDSAEIESAGRAAGVEVVMTDPAHPSGTDRVHEAYGSLGESFDVVLNVQGDEPDVEPDDLSRLIAAFADTEVAVATLAGECETEAETRDESVVKVVRDGAGDALYFSRSSIPSRSHVRESAENRDASAILRHVGVYAFRPAALERFCALPVGRLEQLESLEQLRWLEAGERMRVVSAGHVPRGIDTRKDYEEFVARRNASCT